MMSSLTQSQSQSPSPCRMRALAASDISAVQAIDQAVYDETWSLDSFVEQVELGEFDHRVAVATDDTVVGHGSMWSQGSVATVMTLAVDPSFQGHGVASSLLLDLCGDLGDSIDELRLEVRPDNHRAQRLYRRFGFAPIGVHRDFYPSEDDQGGRDALVMRVDAPNSPAFQHRLEAIAQELDQSTRTSGSAPGDHR